MALTVQERFWAKVRKGPSCWEWVGATRGEKRDRGIFYMGGGRANSRLLSAHRASWELHFGPIPNGLHVLHKCDNGLCVRPSHLELGNHAKNMRDAAKRGLMPKGPDHHAAKLTPADVREIRRLVENGVTQRAAGERFGVSRGAVLGIVRGENWGWLK